MLAVYIAPNEFTVYGNKLQDFIVGRRLKFDCGVDGIYYSSVQSASYIDPSTFITTNSGVLTSNLSSVLYGIINTGAEGSLPGHLHDGNEGQGDRISFNSLLDTDDVSKVSLFTDLDDTPNSYVPGKILKTTASGLVISDGLTFLELVDTPSAYADKYTLKCTTSGIEFDQVTEWYAYEGDPTSTLGKRFDYYVDYSTNDLWRKDPGWIESSGAMTRNFDLTPTNLAEFNLAIWGSPSYNSTYYTFPLSTSAAIYSAIGVNHIDESGSDIKVRFRTYNRTLGAVQLIAGFGNTTNGIAIGIDASNNLGVFGRSGGVLTSITIDSSKYKNYTWYVLYASSNRLTLHEEGTLITIEATGSCISGDNASSCTNFGNSPNGNAFAVIANVACQFAGDIDYVKVYNSGDLDFPDFSESNATWKKIGSVASNHMAFTGLSDTPDTYVDGFLLRSTSSGISLVNVSEWFSSEGAPINSIGKLNDYHLNSLTNDIWRRTPGWVDNSGSVIVDYNLGSSDMGSAGWTLWQDVVDNGTYYTFGNTTTGCLYKTSFADINETTVDIKIRFRAHNRAQGTPQHLFASGDNTSGMAIGINSYNEIGIFGRDSSGVLTSITIPSSAYSNNIWYVLYASKSSVLLHEDGTTNAVQVFGTCTPANVTSYAHIGYNVNCNSPISATTGGLFDGDIDYIKFYLNGELDFPDFSPQNSSWEFIGSIAPVCSGNDGQVLSRNSENTMTEWTGNLDFGVIMPTILDGDLIMPMTSNTEPSGIASAQSERSVDYRAYKAFDGNASTLWWAVGTTTGKWISFDFEVALIVNSYELGQHNLRNWSFQGYNGSIWTTLHTVELPSEASDSGHELYPNTAAIKTYTFTNANAYSVYRIYINGGISVGWWDFGKDEAHIYHLQMIKNTP